MSTCGVALNIPAESSTGLRVHKSLGLETLLDVYPSQATFDGGGLLMT